MTEFLRRYVFHNFGLKLTSLAIAVVLWAAVAREPASEVRFNVPIGLQHLPEHLEITSETIPEAQVRLRGPARSLQGLQVADVRPVIDLADAQPGTRTYDLDPDAVSVPFSVKVVQVTPSHVVLNFDRRDTRQVEVRPRITGEPAAGYRIAKVVVDPPQVVIVGPEQRVHRIESVLTDPVDVTGVVGGSAIFVTAVHAGDPLVHIQQSAQVRVTVMTEKEKPE